MTRPNMSKPRRNKNAIEIDKLHDRIDSEVGISEAKHARGDIRHAELAELVQKMTVALETLEQRVEAVKLQALKASL